jgi:hypothetical protein
MQFFKSWLGLEKPFIGLGAGMARSFIQLLKAVAIGCLSLYASNSVSHADITDIELKAFPSHYEGPCPYKIIFTGYITVNRPETIVYHFHHSDLSWDSSMTELTFRKAGTYPIQSSRTIGSPGLHYQGYENVEIMRGVSLVTTPIASFNLSCSPNRSFPETVTGNPQERFLDRLFSQARQEVQGLVTERIFQQSLILQQSSLQNDIVRGNVSQQQFYATHGLPPYGSSGSQNQGSQTRISPYPQFPIFPRPISTAPVSPPATITPPVEPSNTVSIPQTTITPYTPPATQPSQTTTSNYQQFIQKNSTQAMPATVIQAQQIQMTPYQTYTQQPSTSSTQAQPSSMSYQQFLQESSAGSMRITPYQQFIQGTPALQPATTITTPTAK